MKNKHKAKAPVPVPTPVPIAPIIEADAQLMEAARQQAIDQLASEIHSVTQALLKEATQGNIQAIRLVFEVLGIARQPRLAVAVRNEFKPQMTLKLKDIMQDYDWDAEAEIVSSNSSNSSSDSCC